LTDLAVCGRMLLKSTLKKWTKFSWLRVGSAGETCECGSDLSGSIRNEKILEKLSHCYLIKTKLLR
jgi:hypothetical protein